MFDLHDDGRKKRVVKACDSCRMKKTKCDGKKPCSRCSQDDKICTYSEKKKHQEKLYSSSYVELLETRIDILQECLQRMVYNISNNEDVSQFIPSNRDYSINNLIELFAKDPQSRFYGGQFNPTDSDDEGVSPVKVEIQVEEKPKKKRGRRRKVDIEREKAEKEKEEREKEERARERVKEKADGRIKGEEEEDDDDLDDHHDTQESEDEMEDGVNITEDRGEIEKSNGVNVNDNKKENQNNAHSHSHSHSQPKTLIESSINLSSQQPIEPPIEPPMENSILTQLPPLETESPFSTTDLISPQSVTTDLNFDYGFDLGQYRSGAALAAAAITGEYNPSDSGSISSVASSPTVEADLIWGTVSPALLNDTSSFTNYQNFSRSTDDLLASSPSAINRLGRQSSTGMSPHHTNNKIHKSGSHHYHHHHPGASSPSYGSSRLRERSRSKTGINIPTQRQTTDDPTQFNGQSRSLEIRTSTTFPIMNYSQHFQQQSDTSLLFGDHQMGEIDDLNLSELLISNEGAFYSEEQGGLVK